MVDEARARVDVTAYDSPAHEVDAAAVGVETGQLRRWADVPRVAP